MAGFAKVGGACCAAEKVRSYIWLILFLGLVWLSWRLIMLEQKILPRCFLSAVCGRARLPRATAEHEWRRGARAHSDCTAEDAINPLVTPFSQFRHMFVSFFVFVQKRKVTFETEGKKNSFVLRKNILVRVKKMNGSLSFRILVQGKRKYSNILF